MYEHIQRSPLHLLLYLPAAFSFILAWQIRSDMPPSLVVLFVGVALLLFGLSFQTLSVTGRPEHLDVRYGPLNLFGTSIAYRDIAAVAAGETSIVDGWGIHFIPFRGWTLNLWGFECVKITRGNRVIRIGTDDSENLVLFLRERLTRIEDE